MQFNVKSTRYERQFTLVHVAKRHSTITDIVKNFRYFPMTRFMQQYLHRQETIKKTVPLPVTWESIIQHIYMLCTLAQHPTSAHKGARGIRRYSTSEIYMQQIRVA